MIREYFNEIYYIFREIRNKKIYYGIRKIIKKGGNFVYV